MYLHRYIRLTPALIAAVLFAISVYRYMGNGPMWKSYSDVAGMNCKNYWWSLLLYVQNYVNKGELVRIFLLKVLNIYAS